MKSQWAAMPTCVAKARKRSVKAVSDSDAIWMVD
jgi:hypothetical protein